MPILAEAEILIRPVTQQFASQLDKQVQASVTSINKKAIISPKIDDKGQTSKFTGALSKLDKGLQDVGKAGPIAQTAIGRLGSGVSRLTSLFGGAVTPIAALGLAVGAVTVKGIHDFVALATSVRQFQIISGATAQDASKLVAASDALGVSTQAAGTGVFFLEKNLEKTAPKLAALGVEVVKTKDGALDLSSTFLNVADAISKTADPAERAQIAFTAFGRGGKALLPILEQGRVGIQKLFDEAGKHGQILDQSQVDNAFKFKLALHDLGEAASKFGRDLGSAVVPALAALARGLDTVLTDIGNVASFLDRNLFGPLGHDFNVATNAVDRWAQSFAASLHIPQDQGLLKKISQGFADTAASAGLSADQIKAAQIQLGLIPVTANAAATSTADATQATDALAQSQADAAAAEKHHINQLNALKDTTTHVFGDTKHQVLEWQKTLNTSLNFVAGDLSNLAGKAKLSAKDIVKSFDDQLKAEGKLTDNFDTLLKRHLPADFIKQLADMGAQGAPLVSALAAANKTQFDKIVNDWEQAAHHSHDTSREIRQAFIGDGPIKIPITTFVDVKQTKKTEQDFRNSVRDRLEGGIPVSATPKVTTPNVDITATNVVIKNPNAKGFMAGGFLPSGQIGLTGERGPELVVGGSSGSTIIPNQALGFSSQDIDRIIAALEKILATQRPINVTEVAQNPVATAESVAARLGLAGVR